jgi:antitoxin component YwqK of YwqJK toxin-antitoxin module
MLSHPLNDLTVIQLKDLARNNNISGYSKLRKAELIDLLIKNNISKEGKIKINSITEVKSSSPKSVKTKINSPNKEIDYLPVDIVNYGLQGYLNYDEDVSKLEEIYNKKLDIKQHLTYQEDFWDKDKTKIESKTTFLDGKRIKYELWFRNGNKNFEDHYKNNMLNGIVKEWYENGSISSEEHYKNGKWDGVRRKWNPEGYLKEEENYKNDYLDGIKKLYYEDGKLRYEQTYKNGQLNGLTKYYYRNGQLEIEQIFKNDKSISEKFYNRNGELVSEKEYRKNYKYE